MYLLGNRRFIMKQDKQFFDKLTDKLEELFPKLNQKDPSKQSPNHRSEALCLNAFANIYHNERMDALVKTVYLQDEKLEQMTRLLKEALERPNLKGSIKNLIKLLK